VREEVGLKNRGEGEKLLRRKKKKKNKRKIKARISF